MNGHSSIRGKTALLSLLSLIALSALSIPATGLAAFLDDFEDGNHNGWLVSSGGGGGSNGVEFYNESKWAFVANSQSGKRSLSREFDYDPTSTLSFAMQALANTGRENYGDTTHASSGVTILFENRFNVALGEISFIYATSASLLPTNSFPISNLPNTFAATMSDWANAAMVNPAAAISSISVAFWAQGTTAQVPAGSPASAHIRFDNIAVTPVPEPEIYLMLSVGLGLVGWAVRWRNHSAAY